MRLESLCGFKCPTLYIDETLCVQVQGKDPSVDITQDTVEESEDERFDDTSDSAPVELPPCELARLEEISEVDEMIMELLVVNLTEI
jgi:uncharacterized metal-binding protein